MRKLQQGRTLSLVVGCTLSKTLDPAGDLLLRNLPSTPDRCSVWASRLRQPRRTAGLRDLYKGQQWRSVLDLEQVALGRYKAVQLWVVSAGLGLRPAEHQAPGYSAGFAAGPDAVGATLSERRAWWMQLQAQLELPDLKAVRSSADEMLVALSPSYLAAVREDLTPATDDGLAVLTSGQAAHAGDFSSAGLQSELGGSDQTLNQRAAVRLIEFGGSSPIGSHAVRDAWLAWADARRTSRAYDRKALSDDALREIIRVEALNGATSASRLLKKLRHDGYACEQKRFHRLYAETMAGAA